MTAPATAGLIEDLRRFAAEQRTVIVSAEFALSVADALAASEADARRYRWAKPILSGDDAALADARICVLAAGLMADLDPDAIIDAALTKEPPCEK